MSFAKSCKSFHLLFKVELFRVEPFKAGLSLPTAKFRKDLQTGLSPGKFASRAHLRKRARVRYSF